MPREASLLFEQSFETREQNALLSAAIVAAALIQTKGITDVKEAIQLHHEIALNFDARCHKRVGFQKEVV